MGEIVPKTAPCTCVECKKPFLGAHVTNKYCSDACRNSYAKKHQKPYEKKPAQQRLCEICGKEYMTTRIDQKYCNPKCGKPTAAENWASKTQRRRPKEFGMGLGITHKDRRS